jgi:Carboxypeptidase regulatory-like domain
MVRTSRRGVGLLAAATALLVLPGTVLAANATGINITVPNSKAAITGTITRHGGGAIKNATVELVDPAFGFPSDYTFTDSTGKFTFFDKTDSSFLVVVDPHQGAPTYEPGYYRKTDPDHFTTTSSNATELHYTGTLIGGMNIAVRLGHSINGHVHRQKNGSTLKGVTVRSSGSSLGAQAVTDAAGNYSLQGLPNGAYHLTFTPPATVNVLGGCFRNAPPHNYTADCSGSASNIVVNNANVASKNVDLPDGHLITGKVQDAQGHSLCAAVSAQSTSTFVTVSQATACGPFTLWRSRVVITESRSLAAVHHIS